MQGTPLSASKLHRQPTTEKLSIRTQEQLAAINLNARDTCYSCSVRTNPIVGEALEGTLLSEACASRIKPASNEGSDARGCEGSLRGSVQGETIGVEGNISSRLLSFSSSLRSGSANKRPVKLFNERSAGADFLQRPTHPLPRRPQGFFHALARAQWPWRTCIRLRTL